MLLGTIPQYSPISHGITQLLAGIVGIPLDGVDGTAVTGLYNPYMVSYAIAAPIEINDRTWSRNDVSILPLASGAEPFHAGGTVGVLGHNTGFNITALVGAPAHKTGAPLHTGAECGSAFHHPWK